MYFAPCYVFYHSFPSNGYYQKNNNDKKKKIMQHNLVTGISRKEYGYPISLFLFCYQAWIYKWAKLAADLQFRMFGYLVFLS